MDYLDTILCPNITSLRDKGIFFEIEIMALCHLFKSKEVLQLTRERIKSFLRLRSNWKEYVNEYLHITISKLYFVDSVFNFEVIRDLCRWVFKEIGDNSISMILNSLSDAIGIDSDVEYMFENAASIWDDRVEGGRGISLEKFDCMLDIFCADITPSSRMIKKASFLVLRKKKIIDNIKEDNEDFWINSLKENQKELIVKLKELESSGLPAFYCFIDLVTELNQKKKCTKTLLEQAKGIYVTEMEDRFQDNSKRRKRCFQRSLEKQKQEDEKYVKSMKKKEEK